MGIDGIRHPNVPAGARSAVFHDAALGALGMCDDQGHHYYAAFLIDPDGHRIEAVCKSAI